MSSTQQLLDLIESNANIRMFQIPQACKEIARATCNTIVNLPDEHALDSVLLAECRIIDRVVRAYYADTMESARQFAATTGGSSNLSALDTVNDYQYHAGTLLRALMEGFEEVPGAKDLWLQAAKDYNDHITTYSMSYKSSYRLKATRELAAKIRKHDASYRKPVKCIGMFWLVLVAVFLMLATGHTLGTFDDPYAGSSRSLVDADLYVPYQQGISCVLFAYIETAALAVCGFAMKKEKHSAARIAALAPLASRLLCGITGYGFLYRLSYASPSFSDLFDEYTMGPLQLVTMGLNLALLALLAAYLFGKIPTTRKNLYGAVLYVLAGCAGLTFFLFVSMGGWPNFGTTTAIYALASCSAAASIIFAFPPAVDDYN